MIHARHLRRSLFQFRAHPLRTSLALLGMVLGVGSVVAMVSIGEGAQRQILASIESLGGDVVHVKARDIPQDKLAEIVKDSRGLSRNDVPALERALPGLGASAYATISDVGVNDLPVSTADVKLVAAQPSLFDLHRLVVAQGRRLFDLDDRDQRKVAVLGAELAEKAFPQGALGKRIRLGYAYFEVVGVLARKRAGADLALDPEVYNRAVVVPFSAAVEEVAPADAYAELDILSFKVDSLAHTLEAKRALGPMLKSLHGGVDDFEIVAPEEILEKKQATQGILNLVLLSVAAISLLVGGIGVMNIMLANIMERITEIGLRRAIGASQADIRAQFLVEAVIICFVGGVIGIVLGFGSSLVVGHLFTLEVAFAWKAMLASFALSAGVGLLFGIWPATRAAKVDPIHALQHE